MSLAAKCRLSWARPAYTQVFYSEKLLMVWANYLSSHLPLPLTQLNTNLNVESSFLPTQMFVFSLMHFHILVAMVAGTLDSATK